VSAVGRSGDRWTQARFDVHANWRQFHRLGMERWNRYENVLNVHNVGKLHLKWSYNTGSVSSSPAVANGVVYVGSLDHNVYGLNASTGAKLWSYATGGYVWSAPAVANRVVYVGSIDRNLYAFGLPGGDQSKQGAASQRPDPKTLRPDFNLNAPKPVVTPSVR